MLCHEKNNYNWNLLIWNKLNPIPAYNNSLLPDIEYCVFIREKGAYFNNKLKYNDYRKVMSANVAKNNFGHPTQKHLWMIEKMIKISSEENDIILDCYAGSGTTGMACQNLKRNYILIEKEEKYCEMCRQRLRQKTLF